MWRGGGIRLGVKGVIIINWTAGGGGKVLNIHENDKYLSLDKRLHYTNTNRKHETTKISVYWFKDYQNMFKLQFSNHC